MCSSVVGCYIKSNDFIDIEKTEESVEEIGNNSVSGDYIFNYSFFFIVWCSAKFPVDGRRRNNDVISFIKEIPLKAGTQSLYKSIYLTFWVKLYLHAGI